MIRQPVSQSILLVFHRNVLTDRLLLRERERDWSATQVFLISRETPDKISRIQKVTRGPMVPGSPAHWLTLKCHILVINVVTGRANSKNPPL